MVAARADRRHVAEPARLREVGRRRHAPLRVEVARAEPGVDAFLPRRGPPRRAQPAHAEEALDQPVVLEHLDAPGDRLVEQSLVQLAVLRMRTVAVDPHRELVAVRRLRRQVPAVRDERAPAEAFAQRAHAVGQHVGARLPADHARWAERPTRRCRTGAAPRAGTTTSRAAPRRRARRAPRGRRPRRRPSTRGRGPARCDTSTRCRCRSSTTGGCRARPSRAGGAGTPDAVRSSRAQRAKQSRAPSPAMIASSVANPAVDLVDVAVPTHAQPRIPPAPCSPGPRSPARGTTAAARAASCGRPARPGRAA